MYDSLFLIFIQIDAEGAVVLCFDDDLACEQVALDARYFVAEAVRRGEVVFSQQGVDPFPFESPGDDLSADVDEFAGWGGCGCDGHGWECGLFHLGGQCQRDGYKQCHCCTSCVCG